MERDKYFAENLSTFAGSRQSKTKVGTVAVPISLMTR